ncbi:hypothetical protein [Haploplasma axanthum]|uniref:Preprotein translocase subunit SecB n=1 Tax=Haploplasma axanthum TaxID=29552 RepID=A0A449BC22_HAPAX|nr:hypothetical protein [Haploplasma axanthum]VEU79994.1 Uncharacterised protein [Haploplasma axanthum]
MNTPVYDLIAINLIKVNYNRDEDTQPEFFKISAKHSQKNLIETIFITIDLKFENQDVSSFVFKGEFKINDESWREKINNEQALHLFFSVSFPFVRSMINSITDDSRGSIMIPIIDLRGINLEKGIIYTANKK